MDDLPQELVDDIIDFLQDDKASLAACSVLSTRWARARRYLFRTIDLSYETLSSRRVRHILGHSGENISEEAFHDALYGFTLNQQRQDETFLAESLESFVAFASATLSLVQLVEELFIAGPTGTERWYRYASLSGDQVVRILALLPKLRKLRITDVELQWDEVRATEYDYTFPLEALDLDLRIHEIPAPSILWLLRHIDSLRDLRWDINGLSDDGSMFFRTLKAHGKQLTTGRALEKLHVAVTSSDNQHAALVLMGVLRNIPEENIQNALHTQLEIGGVDNRRVGWLAVLAMLSVVGPSVRTLTVNPWGIGNVTADLGLSRCTSLRELRLDCRDRRKWLLDKRPLVRILSLFISQASKASKRGAALSFVIILDLHRDASAFEIPDAVFGKLAAPGGNRRAFVRGFRVRCGGRVVRASERAFVADRLPAMDQAGTLFFE
ncbi:hypothetical protein PsYK624_137650 [Phanerochaete sordida]|uniref:F-box domain-containing protein n=1 Tax=Phanerochaete sordida TaxID=48140 RepID=A0A9P3GNM6_9APHY|nr:hypothetical protein PsYK624_137650 [Phanerochaete sordida]